MAVEVRAAVPGDAGGVQAVFRAAAWSNAADREYLTEHPDALEFPAEAIDADRVLVAVEAGRVVGFVSFGFQIEGSVEVDDLFVEPRWQRRGIGRMLVTALAEDCRSRNAERLLATANTAALGFYRALGFRPVGEAPTDATPAPRLALEL